MTTTAMLHRGRCSTCRWVGRAYAEPAKARQAAARHALWLSAGRRRQTIHDTTVTEHPAAVRRKAARRTSPVESVAGRDSYAAFMGRAVRAYVRRAGEGDLDALEGLVKLQEEVQAAVQAAGAALHTGGYSWAEIAAPLGITRQAAAMRFGGAR